MDESMKSMTPLENRFEVDGERVDLLLVLETVAAWLREPVDREIELAQRAENIEKIRDRLSQPFKLGIIGQFRAGKSSLINAVVGAEVAFVDEIEATATISRYYFAEEPAARIVTITGERTDLPIQSLLELADERRDDTGWLASVERLEFAYPSENLRRVEFWDTPGLGGADINHATAERFVQELDAAVWVFDAKTIGMAGIAPAMEELSKRGKLIVGVVNKAEVLGAEDFARAATQIPKLYANVVFKDIVPFSAILALASQGLSSGSPVGGDAVDADGGLARLVQKLHELILMNPERLSSQAAAGDTRAILASHNDQISALALRLSNQLERYESLLKQAEDRVAESCDRIGERMANGCVDAVRTGLRRRALDSLQRLTNDELRSKGRLRQIVEESITREHVEGILEKFVADERPALQSIVEALGLDMQYALQVSLTAPERLASAALSEIEPAGIVETGPLSTVSTSEQTAAGTGILLSALALLIPGPQWPFVVAGTLFAYIASRLVLGTPSDPLTRPEQLRDQCVERLGSEVERYVTEIQEEIEKAVRESVAIAQTQAIKEVGKQLTTRVLNGEEKASVLNRIRILGQRLSEGVAHLESVERFTSKALPQSTDLLGGPAQFERGQRGRAQELWSSLTGVNTSEVLIVDGQLSSRGIELLSHFDRSVPIRIVTWEEPLASTTVAQFVEAIERLRVGRDGSVSVVVPTPASDDPPALPTEAFVGVSGAGFLFSVSLGDAMSGKADFEFKPLPVTDETCREFGRWWNRGVNGYRYLSL